MKNYITEIKNKIGELSESKKTLLSLGIVTFFFIIATFLFSVSFRSYYYGYNYDWYIYISNHHIDGHDFIFGMHFFGLVFDKLISLIFTTNPAGFYIFTILGSYGCILSLYYACRLMNKNRYKSILLSFFLMASLPFYSIYFEVRSCQFLFAPLFFLWAFIFYLKYRNNNKILYYTLSIAFSVLFIFEFPTPIVFLPLLVCLFIKSEKNIKNIIPICCLLVFSIVCSIRSFIYYTDSSSRYYAYVVDGLLNLVNIPHSYSNSYYFRLQGLSVLSKVIVLASSIVFITLVLSVLYSTITRVIERKDKQSIIALVITLTQFGLIIGLVGFIRYFSVLSLLTLSVLLIITLTSVYDAEPKLQKLKLSSVSVAMAVLGMLLCITPYYTQYSHPSSNYIRQKIRGINALGREKHVVAICYQNEYEHWKLLSSYLDKNYDFEIVNVTNDNYYDPSRYATGVSLFGFYDNVKVDRGVSLNNEWITGNSYKRIFYTTDTEITLKYSIPEEFPENNISIYCNDVLIKQEENWKGESSLVIKTNKKSGAFIDFKIVCEKTFKPADYIEGNEDYRDFSLFIDEFVAH